MNGIPSVVVSIGCVAFWGVLACDAALRVPSGCRSVEAPSLPT